jgi:hypothetical protein
VREETLAKSAKLAKVGKKISRGDAENAEMKEETGAELLKARVPVPRFASPSGLKVPQKHAPRISSLCSPHSVRPEFIEAFLISEPFD